MPGFFPFAPQEVLPSLWLYWSNDVPLKKTHPYGHAREVVSSENDASLVKYLITRNEHGHYRAASLGDRENLIEMFDRIVQLWCSFSINPPPLATRLPLVLS